MADSQQVVNILKIDVQFKFWNEDYKKKDAWSDPNCLLIPLRCSFASLVHKLVQFARRIRSRLKTPRPAFRPRPCIDFAYCITLQTICAHSRRPWMLSTCVAWWYIFAHCKQNGLICVLEYIKHRRNVVKNDNIGIEIDNLIINFDIMESSRIYLIHIFRQYFMDNHFDHGKNRCVMAIRDPVDTFNVWFNIVDTIVHYRLSIINFSKIFLNTKIYNLTSRKLPSIEQSGNCFSWLYIRYEVKHERALTEKILLFKTNRLLNLTLRWNNKLLNVVIALATDVNPPRMNRIWRSAQSMRPSVGSTRKLGRNISLISLSSPTPQISALTKSFRKVAHTSVIDWNLE